MNGDHSIDCEILNAIEQGTLSAQETRRRLEELIDAEIQKTDAPANAQLIDACESLLWELGTHGRLPFESHLEKNRRAVTRRFRRSNRLKRLTKYPLRVAAVTAAMLVLIVVGEAVLRREWFNNWFTEEEDKYFLEGEEYRPDLIPNISADKEYSFSTFSTDDYSEIVSFLGFSPSVAPPSTSSWIIDKYTCTHSKNKNSLYTRYRNAINPDSILIFESVYYDNIHDMITAFEQNQNGEHYTFSGYDIYLTQNYEKLTVTWSDQNTLFSLSGNIDFDEAKEFILSITKGEENNES